VGEVSRAALCGLIALALLCPRPAGAQAPPAPACPADAEPKRIFGIIPNYRAAPTLKEFSPLSTREKWAIVRDDSLDRGTFLLALGFGGEAMFFESSPSFGHGIAAYARYTAAAYADWTLGNVMTEGLYPTVLHQDPRYFRRGDGSAWSRLKYAMSQTLWTHTDSGGTQVNYSELAGNTTAVAISTLYYPDSRTFGASVSKIAVQLGVDMAANILKEFSPDWIRARECPDRSAHGDCP